ncbi:uncharacterized protein C8A04DRAFT_11640 [Dichotomopilus funicola]|uniref:Flo11 n=1 Tax=Dichotomopilus funicola TaxID=1934379 RepID=A0AAN6V4G4_9PEZI|nr:hypothetical protein C8A04DRAFT_11640 [Dichotomopilus funicola]
MASPSPLEFAASRPPSGVASPPLQRMPSRSRTQSISSDRPSTSTIAHSLMSPPVAVSPEPAFIAASAASQIVTNDHDSHAETWYDQHGIEPSGEPAVVSPAALQLVNSFLDQLLFNFLNVARSTTLSALRPAVTEVLKPKLAKDAVNQADEELREYLGGDDEDGSGAQTPARARSAAGSAADWDLELAWKRTRLRCMVYSSLGDMEEEDEDYYMEQGHLDTGLEDRSSEAVSPAVAIFLTSIIEFMGEQALVVAGQASYHRSRSKLEKELKDGSRSPSNVADKVVVEDLDMERVALDRTLGRLWRSWKKKIRLPGATSMDRLSRSYSRDSLHSSSPGHLRSPSSAAEFAVPATVPEPIPDVPALPKANTEPEGEEEGEGEGDRSTEAPSEEYLVAAAIPLPLGDNDVAEIEVPGLARYRDDDDEEEEEEARSTEEDNTPARPKSMLVLPLGGKSGPVDSSAQARPQVPRKRSNSVPTPSRPRTVAPNPGTQQTTEASVDLSTSDAPVDVQEATLEQAKTTDTTESTVSGADNVPAETPSDEDEARDDSEDEVSIEEPRFVRSERVSILGRSPSTASSPEPGKPTKNLRVRTPSIHSVRLIEVTSPRSPVANSQRSSVGTADSASHSSPSRTSRVITTPTPGDGPGRSSQGSPRGRLSPVTTPEPGVKPSNELAERALSTDPEEPATPPRAIINKLTVLPATSSPASTASKTSGDFYIESMPVLPEEKETTGIPTQRDGQRRYSSLTIQPPAVPERSAGRQAIANTSALRSPAAPIGQVSVERSRARSPVRASPSSPHPRDLSAGRNRLQRQPSAEPVSATKLKAVRTSEEGMQARIDVVRNFEELIQSDETIQYTLTPESMRDLDLPPPPGRSMTSSSVVSVKTRKSEEARRSTARRSSSVPRNSAGTPTSAPRSSGSGSHSLSDVHQATRNLPSGITKNGTVVPRSIPPVPTKPRGTNGPQARDPRLARESIAEFAEFIRSTGPPGGNTQPPVPLSPGLPPPGLALGKSVSNTSAETSGLSITSNPNRQRLQARSAAVSRKDDNSDLIDFIRRGPPSNATGPRIPRTVAPFRSTMDSDQLSAAVGGRAVDAQLRDTEFRISRASTYGTEISIPPSIQSVNSHSALLTKSNTFSYDTADTDMPMPKRKTRRVRDPYAIDFSDEEFEDDDDPSPLPPKKPAAKEESLIDFLNNYAPPPEPTVRPFNISQTRNAQQQQQQQQQQPKKKASASSLMARFTRRDSSITGASSSRPASPKVVSDLRSASGGRPGGARPGHIPIQVNIPSSAYAHPARTSSNKAASMMGGGSPSPSPAAGRVPMKKFEPREAASVSSRGGTSDLADFLKHSGPPPGSTVGNLPSSPADKEEGSGGISKVFGRRKKGSVS